MNRLNRYMSKLERIVAVASLVAASLGLVEKGLHYVGVVKRIYRKKRKPDHFGFHPEPSVRRHHEVGRT